MEVLHLLCRMVALVCQLSDLDPPSRHNWKFSCDKKSVNDNEHHHHQEAIKNIVHWRLCTKAVEKNENGRYFREGKYKYRVISVNLVVKFLLKHQSCKLTTANRPINHQPIGSEETRHLWGRGLLFIDVRNGTQFPVDFDLPASREFASQLYRLIFFLQSSRTLRRKSLFLPIGNRWLWKVSSAVFSWLKMGRNVNSGGASICSSNLFTVKI